VVSNVASAMQVDSAGHSRWEEQLSPMDPVLETTEVQKGKQIAAKSSVQTVKIRGQEVQIPSSVKFPMFSAAVNAPMPTLRSVIIGPSAPRNPVSHAEEASQEQTQSGPARPRRQARPSKRVSGPEWVQYMYLSCCLERA